MNLESIRQTYRPKRVRLLLVGESPPAGGEFFYLRSRMTAYTRKAFSYVTGKTFVSSSDFLEAFKQKGCYLEDLCQEPIDKVTRRERSNAYLASVRALAERLRELEPDAVAIILKRIEIPVRDAISKAGLTCPVRVLPFPGNGHQGKYIEQLGPLLRKYAKI